MQPLIRTVSGCRRSDLVGGVLFLSYALVFSWLTISQHNAFRTYALDLAKFDQAIWNTAQGRPFQITLSEQLVLQGHFSPALALFAPLYWFWPDIRLLFILQAICMAGAGLFIYGYFRADRPGLGLLVYAAYLMHPAVHQVNLAYFRRETLAILTTSIALYCLLKRRYGWMIVGLLLTLLCKEDMAFMWVGVGLYVTFLQRVPKVGLPIFIGGAAYLFLVPLVLLPVLEGRMGYSQAESYFGYLGSTAQEIIHTLLEQPALLLRYPLQPERLGALWRFLWPTLFLFALSPEIAIFLMPYLAYMLMSSSDFMGQLGGWYPSILVVLLYWAVAQGLRRLPLRWNPPVLTLLAIAGLSGWLLYSPLWPGANFTPANYVVTTHARQVENVLRHVPTSAVVAAQDALVPHLSHRAQIYLFPWMPPQEYIDYFVFDRQTSRYPLSVEEYLGAFYDILAAPDYEIVNQVDEFYLFRRADRPMPALPRQDTWGNLLTLTGYTVTWATREGPYQKTTLAPTETALRIEMFWRVEQAPEKNYSVYVHVLNSQAQLVAQHDGWPADAYRPTSVLVPGMQIRDVHYLSWTESVVLQELSCRIGLYDSQTQEPLRLPDGQAFVLVPLQP